MIPWDFSFKTVTKVCSKEKESYLLECARYIERNPIRSGAIHDLDKYPWNSFSFYANGLDDVIIKYPNPCYLGLSSSKSTRQRRFREYVLQERPHDQLLDKVFKIE
jgi:putative transposase